MRATEALVFGNTSLGKNDQLLALAMARTWPALYQMLPSWPCVTDSGGQPLPPAKQLLSRDGWPEGVSEDMLERARAAQAMLVNPFDNFGPGIAVTTIMGTNQATGNRLIRKGDMFEKIVMEKKTGDTLVPYAETLAWGENPFRYTVVPFAGQTRPHAELCSDYTAAAYIVAQVNAPAPNP
jgi:hypothetical protein